MTNAPQPIACDEAGFTGNKMLDRQQPYFSYGSVDLTKNEASNLVSQLRSKHRIQGPEIKASKLLKRENGPQLIQEILENIEGRYLVTVADKRFSLAGKFFEYIYEPVLQKNNALFYDNKLHLFVANFLNLMMTASGENAEDLAEQFERFMRTLDPKEAPDLFSSPGEEQLLLGPILRFAKGYRDVIEEETRGLKLTGDTGKWVLDLTTTSVNSHLRVWGERHPILEVTCDDSKPLRALSGIFDVMIDRSEISYLEAFGKRRRMTWNMSRPIEFAASCDNPAVQLADIVAGAAAAAMINRGNPAFAGVIACLDRHIGEDCILPDFETIDPDGNQSMTNRIVLEELARRADSGSDPLKGMRGFYEIVRFAIAKQKILGQGV